MKKYLLPLLLMSASIDLAAQTTILSQDFSGCVAPDLPTGWTAAFTPGGTPFALGWTTADTAQAVKDHFIPLAGHGIYVMVYESYYPNNTPATLNTAGFSLATATHPYLSLDYYYLEGSLYGSGITCPEKAWINISTNGGATWTTIDTFRRTNYAWGTKYVSMAAYSGASNIKLQFYYTDDSSQGYGIAMDNVKVFDAVSSDIAMTNITPTDGDPVSDYFNTGSTATFAGTVLNHGLAPITSFTATYKAGTAAPVTTTITGVNIPPFTTYDFTSTTPYTVTAATNYPIAMWAKIPGDINASNDTATTHIYGYARKPHKKVLFEEATGTWCCYCVRGIVYMDSLKKLDDSIASIIAVHCEDDPMRYENQATQDYNDFIGRSILYSFPHVLVDRYIPTSPEYSLIVINTEKNNFALADMAITDAHITGSNMNVTVRATPATDLDGDYRFALAITEDSVHNDSYFQQNCYSFQADNMPLSGMGYNFQDSLYTIPGSSLYYQYVARTTVPNMAISPNGVAGSLPASMKNGSSYSYTFSNVALGAGWKNKHLHLVAMLINNLNGYVYNTAGTTWSVGIDNLKAGIERMQIFPNPATNEASLLFTMEKPCNVQVKVYDMIGRLVYTIPVQQMNVGEHKITWPTYTFLPGVYNVGVYTETGITTQQLTIQK